VTKAERLAQLVELDLKVPQLTINRKSIYTAEIDALQNEMLSDPASLNEEYIPEEYDGLHPEQQEAIEGRKLPKGGLFSRKKKK